MTLAQISKLFPSRILRINGSRADEIYSRNDWSIDMRSGRIARSYYPGQYRRKEISLASDIKGNHGKRYDHINRDNWDNKEDNLRLCTQAQNCYNRGKTSNTSSKYKGVSWFERDSCWRARIQIDRKQIYIGYFDLEEDAAKAYDVKAKELFKEFAVLNFPY